MSWENIESRDLLNVPYNQNLQNSATYLLSQPVGGDGGDGSLSENNPQFNPDSFQLDDSYSRLAGCGSSGTNANTVSSLWNRNGFSRTGTSLLDCFLACHRSLKQYIARRKVCVEGGNVQHVIWLWVDCIGTNNKCFSSVICSSILWFCVQLFI